MNHVLIVVANMKWNCNIVKDMYDRVLRRKFGILCKDDTSNEDFIKSYLNRLDCEPIDLSCLKDSNLPCKESSSTVVCNLIVNVNVTIQVVGGQTQYTFTATPVNGVATFFYYWDWNGLQHWDFVSGPTIATFTPNANVLVLTPKQLSNTVNTNIAVVVKDSQECIATKITNVIYKGGCTDPDAVNYDPNATFDNDSCYYNSLSMSILYNCNPNESGTVCVYATGGVPPYTVIGMPSGTIPADNGIPLCVNIRNGGSFGAYVIDSAGNSTLTEIGTVSCPFDCMIADIKPNEVITCLTDEFGNNTGQAQLYITPTGGTAPYTITVTINGGPSQPFTNGLLLNHEDKVVYLITDSNECTDSGDIDVDCPPYIPNPIELTCSQIRSNTIVEATVTVDEVDVSSFPDGSSFQYKFTIGGFNVTLPAPLTLANLVSIEYKFSDYSNNIQDTYGPVPSILPAPTGYISTTVGGSDQYISTKCCGIGLIDGVKIQLYIKLVIDNNGTLCQACFFSNFADIYIGCDPVYSTNCTFTDNPQTEILTNAPWC